MNQDAQPVADSARIDTNNKAPRENNRRRWPAVIISLVIILAAVYVAWRWYAGTLGYVSTDDAMIDANRMSVSSKILGRITLLNAEEGDAVDIGQVLVQLDVSDLRAQRAQAQAALVLAEENVSLAQVNLARAQQDFKRAEVQFQNNTIPAEQYDHAQKELEATQAKLEIAQAQTGASHAQISVIDTSLKNATIIAPMKGTVSKRWVLPGDVVQPGQAIFALSDLDSVWVTANLEETKLGRIRPGDSVAISVDAYPHSRFAGVVAQIGSNTAAQFSLIPPNNASGNFTKITQRVPVKISLEKRSATDNAHKLLPGMSVSVKIKI
jgi:membrane fusion protein, multidrug efflux system